MTGARNSNNPLRDWKMSLTLFAETSGSSDSPIEDKQQYGNNYYDPDIAHPRAEYDDDLGVQCPSHSTCTSEPFSPFPSNPESQGFMQEKLISLTAGI